MSAAIVIYQRDGYTLTSYGNGAAYLLKRDSDGAEIFLQYGDDAAAFGDGFYAAFELGAECVRRFFEEYSKLLEIPR